jgi:pimeloyl-ACP methyl ester carboxylesterase
MSMRKWIRRIWIGAGLLFITWLSWNAQARGVDSSLHRSTDAITVTDSGPILRFTPRDGTTGVGLLFLPGATIDPRAYVPLLRGVAEAGHQAVLVRLPWRMAPTASGQAEVWARIASVQSAAPDHRWVLAGHSRGAALSARFAGEHPEAFAGLVLIGTTHPKRVSLANLTLPVTKIYGTRDCVADSAATLGNAHLLPAATRWVRLEGANHQQFGWYGSQLGDCAATITRATQQASTLEALVAALAAASTGGSPSPASAEGQPHPDHPLGTVDFHISCSEPAQGQFNRAVALLHHMTYPQAREAFQRVAATDPQCAMAQWGIAMTLFQPLWPTRPGPEALQRGWEAVQKAKALAPPTERERLFLAAAEAFFLEPASADYWFRIRRWEQAMAKAHASLPDDAETAAFYALAHLATAPSNAISRTHSDKAAAILLGVYRRNPDHPGAMHYLVHANDVPGRERELLEITRKYDAAAPSNPHALHMPTHIFTRLGDWNAVIRGNQRAADAALEHPAGERGELVWDEFPHAIEYLLYAYLQQGADDSATAALARLRATARLEPTFKTAFHLASTQVRFALERRAWNEAARIAPREPATLDWDRFSWPEAIGWFGRGLGAARSGNVAEAKAAGLHLERLEATTRKAGEDLFARNIGVLRLELAAWVAHQEGQRDSSLTLMGAAAALEASTPKHAVTPGPTLPAEELLGDLLMEQTQPAKALAAYRRSNDRYPGRFNGLLGAARAARGLGDDTAARGYYRALVEMAAGGTRRPGLEEAAEYLAPRG